MTTAGIPTGPGVPAWDPPPTIEDRIAVLEEAAINPRSDEYGAVGDGTTDDAAALQAVATAAASGAEVIIDSPMRIDSQVAFAQPIKIRCVGNGRLIQGAALTVPMLLCQGDDSKVDLVIVGSETAGGFDGLDSNRDGVRFDGVDRGEIKLRVSGKSFGAVLLDCNRTDADVKGTGFGQAGLAGQQYHSLVRVSGSLACRVNADAKDVGSAVLNDDSSSRTVIWVEAENVYDNGVYVSSGNHCEVPYANILGPVGKTATGVKARGSGHLIGMVVARRIGSGVILTGNGDGSADPLGANGYGTSLLGYYLEDIALDGIQIGSQDGFYPRGFIVHPGYIKDAATGGGGSAAIRASGHHLELLGGIIDGSAGTTAMMIVTGVSGDAYLNLAKGGKIGTYEFRNVTVDCMRLGQLDGWEIDRPKCLETGAPFNGLDLVDARTVTNSYFAGWAPGSGRVLRQDANCTGNTIDAARSSSGSVTMGNATNHVVDAGKTTVVTSNADFTLTPFTSARNIRHTGTLTADRTITLSTANGVATGQRFRVTRTGAGAFNLIVGGLKNLATGQWCEVVYDGSAWVLESSGSV